MKRGAPASALPKGKRMDTRKHTRHVLRPETKLVEQFLGKTITFAEFEKRYLATLAARFVADRAPFDALAALAEREKVYLGCSCPSAANPDVMHCHTTLALRFMQKKYPDLDVVLPG